MTKGQAAADDAALLLAKGAQRLDLKLVLGPPSPGLQIIPHAPVECLRGRQVASVHEEPQ